MNTISKGLLISALLAGPMAAQADTVVYGVLGTGPDTGAFGTIDLNTGAFSSVGGVGFQPAGLGEVGSTVYTANFNTYSLYSVNTATGAATLISSTLPQVSLFGSTTSGLYEVTPLGELYSVSTSGATTDVGSLGVTLVGVNNISVGGNTLYLTNNGSTYSVSTSTGAATLIGSLGSSPQNGALILINNTLYGASYDSSNSINTINTSTGVATIGAAITGIGFGGSVWGLAPIPVPLPASAWLMLSGLVGVGAMARKRRAA